MYKYYTLFLFSLCVMRVAMSENVIKIGAATIQQPTNKLTAFEHRDNIFIKDQASKVTQLTSSGKNREPLISPDGKKLVFIRKSNRKADLPIGGEENYPGDKILADQIWIVDLKTGKEKCLVSDEDKRPHEEGIKPYGAFMSYLCFSTDGSKLYFLASAAPVTSHLYVVDIRTQKARYFMCANSCEVIYTGKYKNHLMVDTHEYFLGCGSYDFLWLVDENGIKIGAIAAEGGNYNYQLETFKDSCDATTSY